MPGAAAIPKRSLGRRIGRAIATTRRARFAVALGGIVLLVATVASPYKVEQFSMERTLEPGEILLVDRVLPNLTGLSRGDIVLLRPATAKPADPPLVKRVIGLPGETLTFRDGGVWINGRLLDEPYVFGGQDTWPQPGQPATVLVPAGSVYVLGDHRSSSADSRIFGPIPLDRIVGRVWFEARVNVLTALLGT